MKSILNFIKKEFRQFKRDPKMFGIILIAPVIQLIFLGYAANLDIEKIKLVVFDQDKSSTSRKLVEELTSSGYFVIQDYVNDYKSVTKSLDYNKAIVALVIPNDFEKSLNRKETAKLQAIFDAADGNTASIAAGYLQQIILQFAKNISFQLMQKSGNLIIPVGSISPEIRVWYNPTLKTRNYMVPGIVGLLLSVVTLLLTSLAVVKEKEIGTMEQLIVTPLKPYQIIIGKLVPFILLGFLSIVIVLTAMRIVFDIPVKGSIPFLFLSAFFYILSTLGLGLFVSTISKTQQQAMMIAVFAVMMPMVFLSGFAFPIENMPEIIQYISYIIPLKYFINIIRGVISKGLGFSELWINALVLLIMGIFILVLSSLRFQRRLD
ncbi:ABC transporter permease [Ignavibacterium sp.]|uniref:ABC transporter permease n=1 Tax=Ignavibacterium sp. TaxID=2651167 RepID=UPI002209EAB6|nr:ABC transporter permease [Ignavibacterium sp.]BDQ03169.1 MAG: transport permease protein [Ignavibacterium sp.]